MAAFINKEDYFKFSTELGSGNAVVCISSQDGNSAQVAEATDEEGTIIANNVYGQKIAPSNEYQLKASLTTEDGDIKLGNVTTVDNVSICLGSFSIGTSAGSAPTFSASGEQVEANAATFCTFSIPGFTLSKKHHAQILFSAFSYNKTDNDTSTGVHLKSANYDGSCSITKGEKEGVCLTHDVIEAKIECSVEIMQTGNTVPTLTAGTNWVITSPLACTNPDADWPTWSATLTLYLTKDVE